MAPLRDLAALTTIIRTHHKLMRTAGEGIPVDYLTTALTTALYEAGLMRGYADLIGRDNVWEYHALSAARADTAALGAAYRGFVTDPHPDAQLMAVATKAYLGAIYDAQGL